MAFILLFTGFASTINHIGNGIYGRPMGSNPGRLWAVRGRPTMTDDGYG
ncbi:hypothetical protein ACWEO1_35975 [Kitasatospora cineracea]